MREYQAADIRNVGVVGHGSSGKTTLVDALPFVSGSSKQHGSIKEETPPSPTIRPNRWSAATRFNIGCAMFGCDGFALYLTPWGMISEPSARQFVVCPD